MEDLISQGERNRQMEVDKLLNAYPEEDNTGNNINSSNMNEELNNFSQRRPNLDMEGNDRGSNQNDRNVRARTLLEPLNLNYISNRSMNKTREITIPQLMRPKIDVSLKNHVNCMLIRMIANKNSGKNDFLVRKSESDENTIIHSSFLYDDV